MNKMFLEKTQLKILTTSDEINIIYPKDMAETRVDYINGLETKWNYKDNDDKPSEFTIEINNLTKTTANKIALKNNVILNAGYGSDLGEVASGFVIKKEYNDNVLKLTCSEIDVKYNKVISSAYEPMTTASTIIDDIAKQIDFYVKQLELKNDVVYKIGESIHGHALAEIQDIVKDCDSKINIKNNMIYIYYKDLADTSKIVIDYTSGLLEEPKSSNVPEIKIEAKKEEKPKTETKKSTKKSTKKTTKKATTKKEAKKVEIKEDYEVKCLLIHYLKKGDVFHLKSQEVDGDMRILSMSIDDFIMTLKVKVINEKGK